MIAKMTSVASVADAPGYRGINVDVRELRGEDRDAYTGLMERFATTLHPSVPVEAVLALADELGVRGVSYSSIPLEGAYDWPLLGRRFQLRKRSSSSTCARGG